MVGDRRLWLEYPRRDYLKYSSLVVRSQEGWSGRDECQSDQECDRAQSSRMYTCNIGLTRLKSERPIESRRPESLAMFRNISSFLGRLSSIGDLSVRVPFRERAFSFLAE